MTDVQAQELNRSFAINESIDPFGNKWGVAIEKQTALCYIGKIVTDEFDETREVAKRPRGEYPAKYMSGMFTKAELASTEIEKWLRESWDKSDEQKLKAAGKQRAAAQRKEESGGQKAQD